MPSIYNKRLEGTVAFITKTLGDGHDFAATLARWRQEKELDERS